MIQGARTPEASPEYADDISVLLSGMGVSEESRATYLDFLESSNARIATPEIKEASLALGRLYFASLQKSGSEEYSHQEQAMLGFVTGQTIREDPLSVRRAASEFAAHYYDSEHIQHMCMQMFASGIRKLRERAENNPRIFVAGQEALAIARAKLGLSPPLPPNPKRRRTHPKI